MNCAHSLIAEEVEQDVNRKIFQNENQKKSIEVSDEMINSLTFF